jgi:carboxyl-terminal processing protease
MFRSDIVEVHQRPQIAKGHTMKEVINVAQPRRGFLQQATMAAALAISPFASRAQQQDAAEPATAAASSSVIATFDDVWRTVRDRFYDPQLHGLDWSAVRKRYLPDGICSTRLNDRFPV